MSFWLERTERERERIERYERARIFEENCTKEYVTGEYLRLLELNDDGEKWLVQSRMTERERERERERQREKRKTKEERREWKIFFVEKIHVRERERERKERE